MQCGAGAGAVDAVWGRAVGATRARAGLLVQRGSGQGLLIQ